MDRSTMFRHFIVVGSTSSRWLGMSVMGLMMLAGCDVRQEATPEWSTVVDSQQVWHDPQDVIKLDGQAANPESMKARSNEDPVLASMRVSQGTIAIGSSFDLVIELSIDPSYEIYSCDASVPNIPTQLELQLPPGFTATDGWNFPNPARSFNPSGGPVYRGKLMLRQQIQVTSEAQSGEHWLACSVSYQACNSRQCLRPATFVLRTRMTVSHR